MDIEVRALENTDRINCGWYDEYDPGVLGGVGLLAHRGEEMLAAGFLIPTYSNIVYLEFIRTNPKSSGFSRAKAVHLLIKTAVKWTQDHGYQYLTGYVKPDNKAIIKEHQRQGALVLDTPMLQIVRRMDS